MSITNDYNYDCIQFVFPDCAIAHMVSYGRCNPSDQLLHKPGCACIHYLSVPDGMQNPRREEHDDGEDDNTNNDTDD